MKKLKETQKEFLWSILVDDLYPKWEKEYLEDRKKHGFYHEYVDLRDALRMDERLYEFAEILVRLEVITQDRLDELVSYGY